MKKMNESKVDTYQSGQQKLIISRKPGYKMVIPGVGQWKINTRRKEECWVCKQHILTFFFWNKDIGQQDQIVDLEMEDYFEEVLEEIEDRNPGPWPRNFGPHQ